MFLRGLIANMTSIPAESIVDTFKSLIHTFGSKLLRSLDAEQSSELLCLLGTISDDGSGSKYHSAWKNKGRGWVSLDVDGCWEEVVEIAEEKEKLGHVFGERENYWSMRAYLGRLRLVDSPDHRTMATAYYARIPRHSQNEQIVFVPYLDTFLSLPLSPEFYNALDILLGTLTKHQDPDPDVLNLFWKVILRRGNELPLICQSKILGLMRHRHRKTSKEEFILLGLDDIVTALAASIFSNPSSLAFPVDLSAWIEDSVCASLVEEKIPIGERFNNLILVAMWLVPGVPSTSPLSGTASQSYEWRAITGLAVLERFLHQRTRRKSEDLQNLIRLFWRCWKKNAFLTRPKQIDCIVMTSFFKAAVYLEDVKLFSACVNYVSQQGLWTTAQDDDRDTRQVEQLYGSFTTGVFAFKGQFRTKLMSLVADTSISFSQRTRYILIVLQQLIDHDVGFAHQFYCDCLSQGISIPPEAALPLVQQLALLQQWDDVISFLRTSRLNNISLEQLLETMLSVFHYTRQESAVPVVAQTIGDMLSHLYSAAPIPGRLKFPVRFFLPVMITSQHPKLAIQLLESFTRKNPVMFTARFYLRIIETLLDHRQPSLTAIVLRLAATSLQITPGALEALRRKTFRGLIHIGARRLALEIMTVHPTRQHVRDRFVRLYARRPSHSVKLALFKLLPSLCTPSAGRSTILSAIQVLLRNRHFGLARRLIQQSCKHMKSRDLTTICNVYLHGPLRCWNMRGGRLVRHVLRTKDFLERQYGFVPDRATVNIVIKTMLRWRLFMDSRKVRSLFDHLIRNGYPSSERWNTVNGVPFGTPPGGMTLSLTGVRQNMSFKRHVRPLYRMFIKELFLRKDSWAARQVVGILKEVGISAMEQKEYRERVRRLGIVKSQRQLSELYDPLEKPTFPGSSTAHIPPIHAEDSVLASQAAPAVFFIEQITEKKKYTVYFANRTYPPPTPVGGDIWFSSTDNRSEEAFNFLNRHNATHWVPVTRRLDDCGDGVTEHVHPEIKRFLLDCLHFTWRAKSSIIAAKRRRDVQEPGFSKRIKTTSTVAGEKGSHSSARYLHVVPGDYFYSDFNFVNEVELIQFLANPANRWLANLAMQWQTISTLRRENRETGLKIFPNIVLPGLPLKWLWKWVTGSTNFAGLCSIVGIPDPEAEEKYTPTLPARVVPSTGECEHKKNPETGATWDFSAVPGAGLILPHVNSFASEIYISHIQGKQLWLMWPGAAVNYRHLYGSLFAGSGRRLDTVKAIEVLRGLEILFVSDEHPQPAWTLPAGTIYAVITLSPAATHGSFHYMSYNGWKQCENALKALQDTLGEQGWHGDESSHQYLKEALKLMRTWAKMALDRRRCIRNATDFIFEEWIIGAVQRIEKRLTWLGVEFSPVSQLATGSNY
ncbi:hypothetical protein AGABI1DRAFT_107127 [Agaricus bisporus var. burnettii JB137-S8]|uniref:Uncharacterized protein n=1 Tax=Agaricus bisporus var. burnettii (strain JB137-S8 / ATCC MYA-4627 / FGSC 10392) TaxID=597362 RepID=K5WT86_AGABU|nr:uncharacterized protein AGABI1DRAFT_107127 [Agaricus bisporus var. burnettii JB137-S8]EKM78601.1 hypothetical protein AGABI1DRAFT_107127 [Agaricus bisporus var. burnettii JB137-S8]